VLTKEVAAFNDLVRQKGAPAIFVSAS